ncbi:LacI family DNA-binding transcriptional regulator [Phycisphaerales bacterium AB-hyl4]|uniref:LacI family DNA-binding transcriptional regulator n=1 Tax=Natronomicrosphaera hydrolytica TaxID=3242702 RepID=A0ABV4U570_9BACT
MTKKLIKSPVSKPVRLVDIAVEAGVSRSAVANVLLNSAGKNVRVGEMTAKRIKSVASRMGYYPNAAAQRLAGKQTKIIGVVIDSYAPMPRFRQLSEVERAADEHGYRVMIGQSHGEIEKIESYAADFVANRVDGVICISHHYPDVGERIVEVFKQIPNVVYLGQPLADSKDTYWVAVDHRRAMRGLVDHFVQRGRRHIALCLPDQIYQDSRIRRTSYEESLRAHGIEPSDDLLLDCEDVVWDWENPAMHESLTACLRDMLARTPVDALLAINDLMAMHLVRSLRELGKRIPDDVAVAGYDNLAMTNVTIPSITTVDLCDYELARKGFDTLLALIEQRKVTKAQRHQWVEPKLIVRESG